MYFFFYLEMSHKILLRFPSFISPAISRNLCNIYSLYSVIKCCVRHESNIMRKSIPLSSLDFPIYLMLPVALWPWGLLSL
jgi:hypothetical protein